MIFNLYVGANNKTHQIELDKLKTICNTFFEGYTLIPSQGYWQGKEEPSIIVQIETDNKNKVYMLAKTLKSSLKQQAIGLQKQAKLSFI